MPTLPSLSARAPRTRSRRCGLLVPGGLSLALLLLLGCGDESLRPQVRPDQADLYWDLELSYHGVALSTTAPYDTLQLVASPLNYRDEPIAGLPAAQYTSSDPEHVIVTAGGVVIAVAATSQPVPVVATLTANKLKHADTAWVSVVESATPPVLADFSIHPLPPDSAKVGSSVIDGFNLPTYDTLPVRAVTSAGEAIPVYLRDDSGYLPVYFRSSDTTVAKVDSAGVVRGLESGSVNIYARTTAFGVTRTDTLAYRVGAPVFGVVLMQPSGSVGYLENLAPSITIGAGGAVVWGSNSSDTLDIVFNDDDLPNVAPVRQAIDHLSQLTFGIGAFLLCTYHCDEGGNFILTKSEPFVGRYFPVPGTYEYRSSRPGLSGRVIVVDER